MAELRMTTPRLLALQAFLDDPAQERYGLEPATAAGLESGTICPILVAFENAGWLSSREAPHHHGERAEPPVSDLQTCRDFQMPHGFAARVEVLNPTDAVEFRRRALAELIGMHQFPAASSSTAAAFR